jgi:transmembrane 9 superfamily protein 2/4
MQEDVTCQKVCTTKPKLDNVDAKTGISKTVKKFKRRIDDGYRGHFILDNLPIAEVYIWEGSEKGLYYRRGFPLGNPANKTSPTTVNNHLAFTVKYHKPEGLPGWRIVGFEVVPYSVLSSVIDSTCKSGADFDADKYPEQKMELSKANAGLALSWSYSVKWIEDKDVAWSSRWDHYLRSSDANAANIHWFAIVNSLMIVLCLSGMVAMIMLRTLHRDFNRYNNPDNEEEAQEETGWKVVHNDVFREPQRASLLAVYIGSGSQLLGMSFVTLLFALLGFLSPARRGWLMTSMLIMFALMGSLGGFATASLAKMFHAQSWRTILMTGIFFPGKVFVIFFMLNMMLWSQDAASAVPFFTLLGLIALWFLVSIPLVFLGAAAGYKRTIITNSQSVGQIPRAIPEQKWHMRAPILILCAGAVPFGAAFIELYFVLSSLWLNKFYYVFGFFAIVFLILVVTCAEISIVLTYFQLCYEDYRWWWRAFLYSGSTGFYLFVYSIYYFTSTLNMHRPASIILYFSYMSIMSYMLFIACGTIGFLSCFVFVRYIYGALKVE